MGLGLIYGYGIDNLGNRERKFRLGKKKIWVRRKDEVNFLKRDLEGRNFVELELKLVREFLRWFRYIIRF